MCGRCKKPRPSPKTGGNIPVWFTREGDVIPHFQTKYVNAYKASLMYQFFVSNKSGCIFRRGSRVRTHPELDLGASPTKPQKAPAQAQLSPVYL